MQHAWEREQVGEGTAKHPRGGALPWIQFHKIDIPPRGNYPADMGSHEVYGRCFRFRLHFPLNGTRCLCTSSASGWEFNHNSTSALYLGSNSHPRQHPGPRTRRYLRLVGRWGKTYPGRYK